MTKKTIDNIKFKAFVYDENMDCKILVEVASICFEKYHPDFKYGIKYHYNAWTFYAQDFELIQYIGLKDKSDKEIYEGDVIIWLDGGWRNQKFVVKRESIQTGFCAESNGDSMIIDDKCVIVGNIYENPELMKGENDE